MTTWNRSTLARQWTEPTCSYLSNATTNGMVWSLWNTSASTSTTVTSYTSNGATWEAWNANTVTYTSSATTQTIQVTWQGWNVQAETAAQKAARAQRERELAETYRKAEAARQEQRRIAIMNADRLLDSVLTSAQRDQLRKLGGFVLRGQSGKFYRIRQGRSANVDVLDAQGNVVDRLCAYPIMNVPDADAMVAQKLMLECDEDAFLRLALRHSPRGMPPVPAAVMREIMH